MGIIPGDLYDNNTSLERRDELRAERKRLAAERLDLHIHDHAEIARIRQDYGQRIRYQRMDEPTARARLNTLGLSFSTHDGAQIDKRKIKYVKPIELPAVRAGRAWHMKVKGFSQMKICEKPSRFGRPSADVALQFSKTVLASIDTNRRVSRIRRAAS